MTLRRHVWNVKHAGRIRQCLPMCQNLNATYPGKIYGIDIAEIQGRQHLVCMDYKSCCIFERELNGLHTTEVVKALKSIFCDVGAPNKIISGNARYFMSEEFQEFTMQSLLFTL